MPYATSPQFVEQNPEKPAPWQAACGVTAAGGSSMTNRPAALISMASLFYQIRDDGIVISSEPLDENVEGWIEVSPNTAIATDGQTMEQRDFRP
ncbi:hypothetical protein V9K92_01910 [Phyllobacterium sp. CCNWLW109]|uniref:hypothetical protein n=1 Tax=Phyllobacterium sp. CCNWLW109 TaxID=3127479 RepID=UPI0030780CCE